MHLVVEVLPPSNKCRTPPRRHRAVIFLFIKNSTECCDLLVVAWRGGGDQEENQENM